MGVGGEKRGQEWRGTWASGVWHKWEGKAGVEGGDGDRGRVQE